MESSQKQNYDISALQELLEKLEQSEKTQEVVNWVKEITSPQKEFINLLMQVFEDQRKNKKLAEIIIKILKNFLDYAHVQTLEQIQKDEKFINSIQEYVVFTKTNRLVSEAFELLTYLSSNMNHEVRIFEKFVIQLFDALDIIEDQVTFSNIVKTLICLGNSERTKEEKWVLSNCYKHKSASYFLEVFLQQYNNAQKKDTEKYCTFLKEIFEHQKSNPELELLFYRNDFKMLIGIIVQKLASSEMEEENCTCLKQNLEVLLEIMQLPVYKDNKHKIDEIEEILEVFETELEDEEISVVVKKLIKVQSQLQ